MKNGRLIMASGPSPAQLSRIVDGFAKKLGAAVHFNVVLDPKILGGFIAIIDGVVYDASYACQIEEIGKFLLE